ncbi:hypothetical protein Q5752_002993 [Cryptotrichosporon argae]
MSSTAGDTSAQPSQDDLLSLRHLTPYDDPAHPFSSWPSLPPTPLGRLALLTPAMTAAATSSILTGDRLSLNYPTYPSGALLYDRFAPTHTLVRCDRGPRTLIDAEAADTPFNPCFDDLVHLNTQGSTQWDYFMHFSYLRSGLFYGGLTAEQVEREDTGDYGVGAIEAVGGVQTRGILIDVPLYLAQTGQASLDALSCPPNVTLSLALLHAALAHFHLAPRPGDVLLVRTGFEDALAADRAMPGSERALKRHAWAGVQPSRELAEWIWESGFVAVGTDNPTFEEWGDHDGKLLLHMILLSGMGIMIGELMRLNALAAACERRGRWDFFFSSLPLGIAHGVASPCQASAIL